MNLKKLMKQTKTKREKLAKELNIPLSTLDNYIAERREPSIETLMKLATYFNVTLDELCGYDIGQSKKEEIKKFGKVKNDCYNILVSLTDKQAMLVYGYLQLVAEQD